MKIFNIMKKNFRLLMRSRISALIVLFGPLVIILIVGLAFNSSGMVKINLGYYSSEYTNLTNQFVDVLGAGDYTLKKFDTIDECKSSLGTGQIHLCVAFPVDFRIDNTKVNEIDFFVDNSKINFFGSVVDSIESDFNAKALELTTGMTKELLTKLDETTSELINKTAIIDDLKKENIQTKADIERISKEIKSIDLDFDYGDSGIEEVKESGDTVEKQLSKVKGIANSAVNEAGDLIDDVEDFTDDLNLSSGDQDDIDDILNASGTVINDLEIQLISSTNTTVSTDISDLITTLSSNLRSLDVTLDSASKSRDVVSDKVLALRNRVNTTMQKILIVEASFNAITASIKGTQVTDLQTIVSPIKKNVRPVITEGSQLNFYFPYLIMLIIMFIGILLASSLVIIEKTSRAYFRNFVTPTDDMTFIFGTFITTLLVILIQILVILSIFSFIFKKNILPNFGVTALILFLATTVFILIGMLVGNILNSEETGTLASISVGSLLLFISDLIFPLERMPEYISKYARIYNPFVVGSDLLRKSMVHNVSFMNLQEQIVILGLFIIVLFAMTVITYKFVKRHFLLRYSGYLARREIKKRIRQQSAEKLLEFMKNLPEAQYFETVDKKKIRDLKELVSFITPLNEDSFKEYIDSEKNLFADWISHMLKNEELAVKLYKLKRKNRVIKLLKKAIKEFEKLEKDEKKEKKKPKKPKARSSFHDFIDSD